MPQLLEVNRVRINVELRAAPGKHRQTLVLLHGFTGSAAGWGSHLDTFAAAGLQVIALDMLGHGLSEAPVDPHRYSITNCRQDILAALKQLGVPKGRAILLGYSMGGRIAVYTALSGFFRALILESASPGLANTQERAQRHANDEALAERIQREGLGPFISYWENLPLFASQRALPLEKLAALHDQRLLNTPLGLASSLRGVGAGAQPALHQQLPALKLPVLLIAGALDSKYSAIAYDMSHYLPDAQVRIVDGTGHTVHFEQPELFDQLVLQFCQAQSPLE